MGAEEPRLTGDVDRIEFDAGTVGFPNEVQLARHLRHAIEKKEMTISDFNEWLTKPWTAYNFLAGRVSDHSDAKKSLEEDKRSIDPQPIDPADEAEFNRLPMPLVLDNLRDWYNAKDKRAWKIAHTSEAIFLQNTIANIHARLTPYLTVYENTSRKLAADKGLNIVESTINRTKEFLWDNAGEHPELSVGLAIMGFLVMSRLKGTNLMKYLIYGGGLAVGGAFLRREFGVQPTEALAGVFERLGQKGVADKMRDIRETIKRVAFDEKTAGSLPEYYYKKLNDESAVSKEHMVNLNRFPEQTAFHFLLQQNPKKFMEWYNAAYRWKLASKGNVPADVAQYAHQMTRAANVQESVKNLPTKDKVEVLMKVSESVFAYLAGQNPDIASIAAKPGATNAQRGIGVLHKKYIDGSFFNFVWNTYEQKHRAILDDPDITDAKKAHLERVALDLRATLDKVALDIRLNGSTTIDFRDVLLGETDRKDKIPAFKGLGFSDKEIEKAVDDFIANAGEWKNWAKEKGKDAYNEYILPFVLKPIGKKAKEVYEYLFVEDLGGGVTRFDKAIQDAKNAGSATVTVVLNSNIVKLMKQAGVSVGRITKDAWVLSMAEVEKVQKSMETSEQMRVVLDTMSVDFDDPTTEFRLNLGNATTPLLSTFRHFIRIDFVPEIDPNFAPEADRTNPPPHTQEVSVGNGPIAIPAGLTSFTDFAFHNTLPVLETLDATGKVTKFKDAAGNEFPSKGYRWKEAVVTVIIETPPGSPSNIKQQRSIVRKLNRAP
ncbi:MAG TPA: hypothetical protein VJB82_04600 [Candidatus Peribacterales bacterium]|nr:hypothetical protein [Candidatus Peribacterales bacterium]